MVILRVRRFAHRSLFPHTSAMLFPETTICVRITFFTTRNGIIVMERLYCPTHYTGPPAPSIIQIRILGFDTWRLTVISSWIRQVRCEEHPHLELEKKNLRNLTETTIRSSIETQFSLYFLDPEAALDGMGLASAFAADLGFIAGNRNTSLLSTT